MRQVGVREFRDHAAQFLAGDEVLAIERHGQPLGFYIPTGKSRRENFEEALARLEQTVEQVLDETGMSEGELSSLFDLNKPLPDDVPVGTHAPRR
ncbi:MAG: hypothetical protein ACR2JC_17225 [Chloroflexota bacterium]|nr:MAG: hypothetical protein DLM70_05290 [Chloroflexota bacterium]